MAARVYSVTFKQLMSFTKNGVCVLSGWGGVCWCVGTDGSEPEASLMVTNSQSK